MIRFLTEIDYPPFNFCWSADGNPQGFNVDLARMICEELKIGCTIQMRRFETLIAALNENRGDAVIASIAVTPEMRAKVDFTDPYYRTPARFVARRDSPIEDPLPEKLEGRKVAVVAGTAHEAYLKALFTEVEVRSYPNADVARLALRRGDVDLLFGDAISLAFWLNGTDSGELLRASAAAPIWTAAISAKASASRSRRATTRCGSRSTGRCSGSGSRAASPTCGCAIFRSARFDESCRSIRRRQDLGGIEILKFGRSASDVD